MADHVLERRVWLPRPRPDVFGFFADPRNLARVNPPSARLAWLAPPPDVLAAGTILDFRVRLLGLPVRWRVMVREFDPPYRFVDVQLWGPFSRWEHRHRFSEGAAPDGTGRVGTWVEDRVTYRLPLGALGGLAHAVAARRSIAAMFDHRERRLVELFGGAPPGAR
jgi:ligand-binding SRPBCC domain-containing protein